jgi:lipopolysaccharide export system permease protein
VLFGAGVSLADVAGVFVFLLPHLVGYVLPIAFLLGGVIGIGRLAEDREVVALSAAGISPARLVRVPLALGVLGAGLGLWLSLSVEPASLTAARLALNDIVRQNLTRDVRAGTFYDQIPGYTIYAERVREGGWENVLISDRSNPGAPILALAREGWLEPVGPGQEMRLLLGAGEIHREDADTQEYAVAEFRHADVVIGLGTALTDRNVLARSAKELTLGAMRSRVAAARARGDLVEARRFEGYLHRRIAAPLAVLPFALLMVPLGAARRVGRGSAVAATLLAVVAHYVLLRSGEVLAQRGVLPAALSLQLPTLALSLIAVGLVVLQARRGAGAIR